MNCQQCNTPTPADSPYCTSCGAKVMKTINDPLIGRTFLNQYIISKKLGQGGFGSVYEANQPSIGRKAVLKILHQHLSNSPEIAVRFRREGLAASKLTHPSIVRVYNFGETEDGLIWIAMEYIDGETLSARLRRGGPLSTRELCDTLRPICEALSEAHSKGIIHRDLKPDNIMLLRQGTAQTEKQENSSSTVATKRGLATASALSTVPTPTGTAPLPPVVKLLDFGVAGLVDDIQVTSTGMMSGSPPYMPPEQWRGLKYTDARSDVYALGVVAYQCLSGRLPFDADTSPAWMQKHCNEPPIELSDVPKATASVILKAMAKLPEERFESTLAFSKALEEAERGVSQKLPESLLPPKEKSKTPKAFYALTALGIAAAFAVGLFLQRPQPQAPSTPTKPIEATSEATSRPTTEPTKIATSSAVSLPSTAPTSTTSTKEKPCKGKGCPRPTTKTCKGKECPENASPTSAPQRSIEQQNDATIKAVKQHFIDTDFNSCNTLPESLMVPVWIVINTDGRIILAKADPFEAKHKPVFECVRRIISGQTFPENKPGEEINFHINVNLRANFSTF